MPDWLLSALVAGLCSGLVSWGAVKTELRWLRRDVDLAHERITRFAERCAGCGRVIQLARQGLGGLDPD